MFSEMVQKAIRPETEVTETSGLGYANSTMKPISYTKLCILLLKSINGSSEYTKFPQQWLK